MRASLIFKWAFVFSVLSGWTLFVIFGSVSGSIGTAYASDINTPLFVASDAGIERVSSSALTDYLFNYDFSVEEKAEQVPSEDCSIRAKDGAVSIDEINFQNAKLNFYVPMKNAMNGKGYLTAQTNKKRLSLNFNVVKITKTDSDNLVVEALGKGTLDKKVINFSSIKINLDKSNNIVDVSGVSNDGSETLSAPNMAVTFMKGCSISERNIYLITINGKLEKRRSITEVRALLNQYPEFVNLYDNLKNLYKKFWWVALPPGIALS